MKLPVSTEVRNLGGYFRNQRETIKELMVAIIAPPRVEAKKDARITKIAISREASSYLLCSSFHLIISALKLDIMAISIASITGLSS